MYSVISRQIIYILLYHNGLVCIDKTKVDLIFPKISYNIKRIIKIIM